MPVTQDIEVAGAGIHVVHQLPQAKPPDGCRVVVFGHSHKAQIEWRDRVLYINPGAAGRVGFHRTQTLALLTIEGVAVQARIVDMGGRLKEHFYLTRASVMEQGGSDSN